MLGETRGPPRLDHSTQTCALIDAQKVVPLTGDASDRRYFRVLLNDGEADRARAARRADRLRRHAVRVGRPAAARDMPLPVPRDPASLGRARHHRLRGPRRRHAAGASRRRAAGEHAALYRQAVSFIARMQQRGAELASHDYPPYRIAFDVEKLTWELEFFVKHFLLAYRGASPPTAVQRGALEGMVGDRRGAGRRAARAVPSRLSQPQPDAARRRALHHRLPGRADGPRHLRPGVAAARFVRRPHRAAGRRADRLLPGAQAARAAPATQTASSGGGST